MKRTCTNSLTQQSSSSRCSYLSSAGNRCRMPASPDSPYCLSHTKNNVIVASTLAAELSQAAASLGTPEDVSRVLAKIFLALAEDRLSTRKAAVLGYLGQMLLRSHREIAFHKKLADEEAERNDSGFPHGVDILATMDEAPAPAVTPPSQDLAPSASLENGGSLTLSLEGPPLSQSPTPTTSPSTGEFNSTGATKQKPAVSQPSPDPSRPYPPLPDLNHFYPRDPTLRPGLQQLRNTYVPPDEEELRWRELSRRYAPHRRRMQ